MPLHNLDQHYATIIDQSIAHLLPVFHEVSAKDAIMALQFLSEQKMMDEKATEYAPLPPQFSNQRFEKIKGSLQQLHQIMQNCHPERETSSEDRGNPVYYGIFGLLKRATLRQVISSQLIRDYLIYKFKMKILELKIWKSIVAPYLLNEWKNKYPKLYRYELVKWIKNDVDEMPVAFKKIIRFGGRLSAQIKKYIQKTDPSLTEEYINALTETLINHLFEIPPTKFDSETAIFKSIFVIEEMKAPPSRLHHTALNKMHEHIQQRSFTELIPAAHSFVFVELAHRLIYQYRRMLIHVADTATCLKVESYCADYLKQIVEGTPQTIQGLEQNKLAEVNNFLIKMHGFLRDMDVDFVVKFFSRYFGSNSDEQYKLYSHVLALHSENKIYVPDAFIRKLIRHHVQEKNESLQLHPYTVQRIVLHACLIPVSSWSADFAYLYDKILILMQSPLPFVTQLCWLKNRYNKIEEAQTFKLFPLFNYPETVHDFEKIFHCATEIQSLQICHDMIGTLQQAVRTYTEFCALQIVSMPLFKTLCHSLLPDIINNAANPLAAYKDITQYYNTTEAFKILYPLFFKLWPGNRLEILSEIMGRLSHPKFHNIKNSIENEIYFELDKNWPDLIQTVEGFKKVVQFFPSEDKHIFNKIKWKLHKLIRKPSDYIDINVYLSHQEETAVLFNKIKWHEIINTTSDFCILMPHLKLKQFTLICHSLYIKKNEIVQSPDDFNELIYAIKASFPAVITEKQAVIFKSIKNNLRHIVKTHEDIIAMMHHLTLKQTIEMFDIIFKFKISVMTSLSNFMEVSQKFEEMYKKPLPLVLIEELKKLSINVNQLKLIFTVFHENRTAIYHCLQHLIPTYIIRIEDVFLAQQILTNHEFITLIDSLITRELNINCSPLSRMIRDLNQLTKILPLVTPPQCAAICLSLKNETLFLTTMSKLENMIKTHEDIFHFFHALDKEKSIVVFKAIKDTLIKILYRIFPSLHIFFYKMNSLHPELTVSFNEIKPDLVKMMQENINQWGNINFQLNLTPEEKNNTPELRMPLPIKPTVIEQTKKRLEVKKPQPKSKHCCERVMLRFHSLFAKSAPIIRKEHELFDSPRTVARRPKTLR